MLHCTKEIQVNPQIENSYSDIADKARGRYEDVVKGARQRTEKVAGRITSTKKPVKTISRFGVKLSNVSHQTTSKLLKKQTKMVEAQIDALAGRLKAAADATDLRDLVKTQIRLIPENTSRFADDAREAFGIVKVAGGEIKELVKDTVEELRGRKPVAKKTPAHKKTAAKAKKPAVESPETTAESAETTADEIAA